MNAHQRGMTLVEMMIAMSLGLFLMAGMIQIFQSVRQTHRMNQGYSRVQENARDAIAFLNQEARMAGYYGCVSGNSAATTTVNNTLNSANLAEYNLAQTVEGYEASGTGLAATLTMTAAHLATSSLATGWQQAGGATLPTMLSNLVVPGNDVLLIRSGTGTELSIPATVTTGNYNPSQLVASATCVAGGCTAGDGYRASATSNTTFCPQDLVVVSDCAKGRVFQISGLQMTGGGACGTGTIDILHATGGGLTPGNSVDPWNATETYVSGAVVLKMVSKAYFMGVGVDGTPTLKRKIGTSTPEEVVNDVENMQILYGEDTDNPADGEANRYVTADTAGLNFNNVVSVRISLLLRSDNNTRKNAHATSTSYLLGGSTAATATTVRPVFTTSDTRHRMVVTTTIHMRNRR